MSQIHKPQDIFQLVQNSDLPAVETLINSEKDTILAIRDQVKLLSRSLSVIFSCK